MLSVSEYRVPKRELPAEVTLWGQPPSRVSLFLSARAGRDSGFERPSELLNGPGAFLPVTRTEGEFSLFRRDAVLFVTVPAAEELGGERPLPEEFPSEEVHSTLVELTLEGGPSIRGWIRYLRPDNRSRLVDFLNEPERFLIVRTEELVHLVNKNRIVAVSIL